VKRDIFGEVTTVIESLEGRFTEMGSETSGHYGHAGRPGQRGGSAPSSGTGELQFRPISQKDWGAIGGFSSKPSTSTQRVGMVNRPTGSSVNIARGKFTPSEQSMVENAVSKLPQDHLDAVRSITQGDLGRNLGAEASVDRVITMNKYAGRTMYDAGTVVHEVGHAVMYRDGWKTGPHAKHFKEHYKKLVKTSGMPERQVAAMARGPFAKPTKGFPSGYSMFNSDELFAESYVMYVNSPGVLSQRSPDLYSYMRDSVFGGIEY